MDFTTAIPRRKALILGAGLVLWLAAYSTIEPLARVATTLVCGDGGSAFSSALQFFLFETPKVFLLLTLIVFGVGILRSYFPPEKTRTLLEGKPLLAGNVLASLLGIVTPFCSCSAVPLFLGFIEAGVPLGVTFSFLVAAPMINEVAVILLFGLFGWKTALVYVAAGLSVAIAAGWVIGRLRLERWVEDWVYTVRVGRHDANDDAMSFAARLDAGLASLRDVVGKVWPYVIVGIAVGAGVHGYVPDRFMASFMGKDVWYAVPLSVLIGIPLYSNAAGIIPIMHSLLEKGASLGTALAFMMSVIGLSLPETIILRKVLKLPLIFTFLAVVGAGIMMVGFLFNWMF